MKTFLIAALFAFAAPAAAQTMPEAAHGEDHGSEHKDCCDHRNPDGTPMECCKEAADGTRPACCEKHGDTKAKAGNAKN